MRYISLNDVTERLLLEAAVVRESISNLAGTQPGALFGHCLPAPNQLKHRMPRLTPRMIARIQGFPDTWRFGKKKTHACRMIGNAFPPPVAYAVGKEIRRVLENGVLTIGLGY